MRKMMMMALMAVGMTAFASEKNDTTIIENANKVTIITGDSVQTIMVNGKEGSRDYHYVNSIKITDPNVKKCKREDDWENNGLDLDFGVGIPIVTNVPDGWGFSGKSWEIILGLRYKYTPKKALQTYSTGLWCNWSTYALKSNYAFTKDANDVVVPGAFPANASDKYSAMRIFSLSVPFFFTQRFGRTSDFRFTLGPVVNFNVYGRLYNEYTIGDNEFNISTKGFQYRPVTLDIMAMLSWRQLSLFCKYSPMSVLESDKGPQFRSVSVGLFF